MMGMVIDTIFFFFLYMIQSLNTSSFFKQDKTLPQNHKEKKESKNIL